MLNVQYRASWKKCVKLKNHAFHAIDNLQFHCDFPIRYTFHIEIYLHYLNKKYKQHRQKRKNRQMDPKKRQKR